MKWLLTILILVVYVLHQDYWFWGNRSLVLGFMPVGLAYHAAYAVLVSVMMAILVKFAWPKHLEDTESEFPDSGEVGTHA